jgi:predicted ATPase
MATDPQLDTLEAKGLIRVATLQPELEYLFRHALVQDAAYESLLKQERRELHHTVGEALEALYPERSGELASMLALHFEQSEEGERAIPYLIEAAQYAYERNAIVEAYGLFSRAEALLPPPAPDDSRERRRQRVRIDLGRVRSGFSFMNEEQQLAVLEPLAAAVEGIDDLRLAAEVHLTVALVRQFRGDRPDTSPLVRRSLDRVTEIARQLDDPNIAALPKALVGLFQVFTGDIDAGVAALREAAPLLEAKHAFVGSSFALVALAIGLARQGRFDEALEAAAGAQRLAENGDLIAKLDAQIGASTVHAMRGDLDSAIPIALQCTNQAEQAGATACVVASNFVLGDAYTQQGKFEAAQIAFERSNEVAETFQERSFRPSVLAYLRSNAVNLGQVAVDNKDFEEALAIARASHDRWSEAVVVWKRAQFEATRGGGSSERALADYATAAEGFEKMGGRPLLARVLRGWGQALRGLGQAADGEAKLRRALALFEEMGIEREAGEVRAELAAG